MIINGAKQLLGPDGINPIGSDQKLTAGKDMSGAFWIDIAGKSNARAYMTPQQAFELAKGLMHALGYQLDFGSGPRQ